MFEWIILFLAGIGAGIATELVGASAVMVAAPLLIIFLGYPAYLAIGLALSIDVFASLISTIIYYKHGRLKLKRSSILLISALAAVLIGSYFSKNIPSDNLGFITGIGIILAGISIIVKKKKRFKASKKSEFLSKHKIILLILVGLLIGTIAGVFGAGGGIMILLALILILDYNTHEAIGTSVFLMIFIALFGGVAHYINLQFSLNSLIIASFGGIIGAFVASKFANKLDEKILNKLVGIVIIILGLMLSSKNLFFL